MIPACSQDENHLLFLPLTQLLVNLEECQLILLVAAASHLPVGSTPRTGSELRRPVEPIP